jgi:SAM-dependent methyltransferase
MQNLDQLLGADEAAASFDAVICRLGLMLFAAPAQALRAVRCALRPGGKVAVIAPGVLERSLGDGGFVGVQQRGAGVGDDAGGIRGLSGRR